MSLASNLQTAFTRVATEFKSIRTLIGGAGTSDITGLSTTTKASLVAAINEVNAKPSGGATNLDALSDVAIVTPAIGHVLRHDGTQFVNVLGTTYYDAAGAAAAVQSASQPLDADLTAIAALVTTTYGRAFLSLVDQNALMALLLTATTAAQGKVQLATTAEATTGTDTAKAMTAAGTKAAIDQRIVSDATLGGASPSATNAATQASVKAYADALLDANNAYQYKGGIDCSTNPNYPAASAGWTYKVSVAGKIGGASGPNVEVGDSLTCLVDGTAAGTQAAVGANWLITQTNIDGAVVGPASSVSGNLATFSGTTGKIVQDSGVSVDTDAALAANSNTRVPSQAAVRTFAQPKDATLTGIAALTTAADQLPYSTGVDTFGTTPLTAFARTILDDADAATARATLGTYSTVEIGDPTTDFVATFVAGLA